MICVDDLKHGCYPILARIVVDYKEQVLIIRIKSDV